MSASKNKCLNYAIRQILNKTQFTLSVEMFMFREFFNPICDGHTKCRVILIFCNLVVIVFLFNKSFLLLQLIQYHTEDSEDILSD